MNAHEPSRAPEVSAGQIIDGIGGTVATATLCEVTPQAVTQWRREGIPRARMQFLKVVRPELFADAGRSADARHAA